MDRQRCLRPCRANHRAPAGTTTRDTNRRKGSAIRQKRNRKASADRFEEQPVRTNSRLARYSVSGRTNFTFTRDLQPSAPSQQHPRKPVVQLAPSERHLPLGGQTT